MKKFFQVPGPRGKLGIFTVMGLRSREGSTESIEVPFAYALLSGKKKFMYLEACSPKLPYLRMYAKANHGGLRTCEAVFPRIPVAGCSSHLGQTGCRQVQHHGLQARYNDPDKRTLRDFTHQAYISDAHTCGMSSRYSSRV